jgi:hypothetical protein
MKVILEINDKFSGCLSLTAIGNTAFQTFVSAQVVDLSQHNHLKLGADGKWMNERVEEDVI